MIRMHPAGDGVSRKIKSPYDGPMRIKEVLPNDRYRVEDISGSSRRVRAKYDNIIAVDRMKHMPPPGDASDSTADEILIKTSEIIILIKLL